MSETTIVSIALQKGEVMNIDQQLRQIMATLLEVQAAIDTLNRRWERRETEELKRDMMEVRSLAEAQARRIEREEARLRENSKNDKFESLF